MTGLAGWAGLGLAGLDSGLVWAGLATLAWSGCLAGLAWWTELAGLVVRLAGLVAWLVWVYW